MLNEKKLEAIEKTYLEGLDNKIQELTQKINDLWSNVALREKDYLRLDREITSINNRFGKIRNNVEEVLKRKEELKSLKKIAELLPTNILREIVNSRDDEDNY